MILCPNCDHRHPSRGVPGAPVVDGTYSPSGFSVLSSGELECCICDGAGSLDEGGEELECATCEGSGSISCDHSGQATYPADAACKRSGLPVLQGRCVDAPSHQVGKCRWEVSDEV